MGKLFAIAGRPLSGKTEYIRKMKKYSDDSLLVTSALVYPDFETMMQKLSGCITANDKFMCIVIDDFEESLIEHYGKADYRKYKQSLKMLVGLTRNLGVDIYISVVLKRKADWKGSIYCSYKYLRSKAIYEETDGVFFLKADYESI